MIEKVPVIVVTICVLFPHGLMVSRLEGGTRVSNGDLMRARVLEA